MDYCGIHIVPIWNGSEVMSKVVVVIGASHAGKSSFVRNTFVRGRVGELNRDLMPYTELDDCILIGRYDTGERRRDGTDSVERKQVGNFAQQVLNLLPKGKTIVLEGMRAVSRPMMNKLLENGVEVGIIWIHISPEISFQRNQAFGNKLTLEQAKRLDTTCRNFVRDFKGKVNIVALDTEKVSDFATFSVNSLNGATLFGV